MTYLRECCHALPLEELAQATAEDRIPPRAVAVTLDDGTLDHLTTAGPILAEAGVPATFFVNSERLDESRESWWDTLERVVLDEDSPSQGLRLRMNGAWESFPTAATDQRAATLRALNARFLRLSLAERSAALTELLEWSGHDVLPRDSHRALTAEELRRLAELPGVTVGAHTTHHLFLPAQPLETQREEILGCRTALEEVLERPVRLLSYPHGGHDDRTVALASEAGFAAAVTVEEARVRPGVDPLRLPRCEVPAGDSAPFPQRLAWFFGESEKTP